MKSGLLSHWPVERDNIDVGPEWWHRLIKRNEGVQLARDGIDDEDWQQVATDVAMAVREMDESVLLLVDEAHFVAPEDTKLPKPLRGLATTGDGEAVSTFWVTQRLAMLDETVIGCCGARMLGGFTSDRDIKKLKGVVEYPADVHRDELAREIAGLPDVLHADDAGPVPLRRFTDKDGHTAGSEWIYSDGKRRKRIDTRTWTMESTHYGGDRHRIQLP